MSTLDAHFHGRHGAFSLDAAFSLPMHGVSIGPPSTTRLPTGRAVAATSRWPTSCVGVASRRAPSSA